MNRILKPVILGLLALIGTLLGREFGETRQVRLKSENFQKKPTPQTALSPVDSKPEEDEAMVHANTVLFEFNPLPGQPGIFDAIEQLNLDQVRAFHARIKGLPDSERDYRRNILETAANRWVRLDPAHGAEYARKFSPGADVHDRTGLLKAWASHSPEEALIEADKYPGSAKALALRRTALTTLAMRDPVNTLARLDSVADEKERTELIQQCLKTWGATDNAQVAKWIIAHPDRFAIGTDGNEAVSEGIRIIAQHNMLLAIDTAQKLAEPLSKAALSTAIFEWGWQDAAAALDWCSTNGVGIAEQQNLVSTGMYRAPEKIVAKLTSLSAGRDRDALVSGALAGAKPENSDRLFVLLSQDAQIASVQVYLRSLVSRKTGAGWKFATSQPEGRLREYALYYLLAENALPPDIENTLQSLPLGKSRDAAFSGMIMKRSETNTQEAVEKLTAIGDPKAREQIAARVFRRWQRDDQKAAQDWLTQTPHISSETKQKLTAPASAAERPNN